MAIQITGHGATLEHVVAVMNYGKVKAVQGIWPRSCTLQQPPSILSHTTIPTMHRYKCGNNTLCQPACSRLSGGRKKLFPGRLHKKLFQSPISPLPRDDPHPYLAGSAHHGQSSSLGFFSGPFR